MSTATDPPASTRTAPLVTLTNRVRMADTDAAKLIYYAAVFRWAEVLFTDWLAGLGRPLASHFDDGIGFPAVRSEAEYLHPLGLDDEIEFELWPNHVGEHSFSLLTRVFVGPDRLESVRVRVWHAYVEMKRIEGQSAPQVAIATLPDWLRNELT